MRLKLPIMLIMCLSLSLSSCHLSPKNELAVAEQTFIGLAETMHALKDAGQLGADEEKQVRALLLLGSDWLDKWHENVAAGYRDPEIVAAVNTILDQLTEVKNGTP